MNSITKLDLGKAITALCERNSISRLQLSAKSKVSLINNIILAKAVNPRIETIAKSCLALDVGLAEFFTIATEEIE